MFSQYCAELPDASAIIFIYIFIFGLYPGKLDIGLAVALLTNSFLLLLLTSTNEDIRKIICSGRLYCSAEFYFSSHYMAYGCFVIIHVIATSERISLNIFRFLLGILLIVLSYFSVMFFLDYNSWNTDYFPFGKMKLVTDYEQLLPLIPIVLMLIYAVYDHFRNYNKKSPVSRYKYTFTGFSFAQLITIILYMNTTYEYLLLLAFPSTIILSRMLRFLPKYWMQEVSLWLIILV